MKFLSNVSFLLFSSLSFPVPRSAPVILAHRPPFPSSLQALLQDLGRGQAPVVAFNELSSHLLQEYSTDDTRRIKEITDKHSAAWNSINSRCMS